MIEDILEEAFGYQHTTEMTRPFLKLLLQQVYDDGERAGHEAGYAEGFEEGYADGQFDAEATRD